MKHIITVAAALALVACGKHEVSFDTLETARAQAKENAELNARTWRAQTAATAQLSIISRGDSSQTPACPQGDGWASIDLVNGAQGAAPVVKLKCSTVSVNLMCRADADFKASPHGNEDGRCNDSLPHPLPKLAK